MSESQIAGLIKDIEKDPLFQELLYPRQTDMKVIRFHPHPRTRLSSSFYELNERAMSSDAPADVSSLLEDRKGVLELIHKMGRETFEKHFLRAEEALTPAQLAEACGISEKDAKRLQDFLLTFSVHAEFFDPSSLSSGTPSPEKMSRPVTRLAHLALQDDGDVGFDLVSPHLARGRYDIHYDRLQSMATRPDMTPEQKRRLRAFIRRLEMVNWRQNTLFRILDLLCHSQRNFLKDKDSLKRGVVTQRQMSRLLSVAPSTVNRAIQARSLVLPWGEELLLEDLFCSRKTLCLDALEALESKDPTYEEKTDIELRKCLQDNLGIPVPVRTVNTYRRLLAHNGK